MIGSRPSGTLATINPIANVIAALHARPAARPAGTNAAPITIATAAMIHVTCRTWRSNGLGTVRPRCDRAAMRPSSVNIPARATTTLASPPVHVVPLNTRSAALSSGPLTCSASATRRVGATRR